MKRAWMPSPRSASAVLAMCFAASALALSPVAPDAAKKRSNELTLARLRPGHDASSRALRLYKAPIDASEDNGQRTWWNRCLAETLVIESDASDRIQTIRLSRAAWVQSDCSAAPPSPWKTGKGLRLSDFTRHVIELYGAPDSRSPSTKGGQQLELLYYAFDWAGPDVPQVMEVLCTPEKDGIPGRVVEITLAAPSL